MLPGLGTTAVPQGLSRSFWGRSILTGQQHSPAALASPSRPGAQNNTSNWTQKGIRVQMVSCLCKFSSSSSVFSQRPMPSPAVSVKGADLNDLVPTSASHCIHTALSTRKSTLSLSRFPFPRKINYSKREQTSLKCMTSHYWTQSTRWRARSSDWISECEKHPTLRARAGAAAPGGSSNAGALPPETLQCLQQAALHAPRSS